MRTFTAEEIALCQDIARQAGIAIENARLFAAAQDAKEAAEEANRAKSDFVSVVSHELKNPMTSIRGYADLLLAGIAGAMSEKQADFLKRISTNVSRMQTIVSDLADISRIESGRFHLDFDAVALVGVVEEVVRSLQGQIEAKGQDLQVDIPAGLSPVWGDRSRLIQILTNLVSNAHKYTPDGGEIRISLEQGRYTFDGQGPSDIIHLIVADNGIGITPEDQEHLFQKFFRASERGAQQAPGTGLGLNITKNLVELQGGRIWFESEYGQGSTFHVIIPTAGS